MRVARCTLVLLLVSAGAFGKPFSPLKGFVQPPGTGPYRWLGPRVKLDGAALTLGQALVQLDRQLNLRCVVGTGDKFWSTRTFPLHARGLSPLEAFELLENTYDCAFVRRTAEVYDVVQRAHGAVPANRTGLCATLGPRFPQWRVWLRAIRAEFRSRVTDLAPPANDWQVQLVPEFAYQAPSEPEMLRLASVGAPSAVTTDGWPIPAPPTLKSEFILGQPNAMCYQSALPLVPPSAQVARLRKLGVELTFREIRELTFSFDRLDVSRSESQVDAPLEVELLPRGAGERGHSFRLKALSMAELRYRLLTLAYYRRGGLQAHAFRADGEPLVTTTSLDLYPGGTPPWPRLTVSTDDKHGPPARIELSVYYVGEGVETAQVEFDDVPVPALP